MGCANLQGNLSGVTSVNYGVYQFVVECNPNLCGSNEFVSYLFTNRRNWNNWWSYWNIYCIGDKLIPTGSTEHSGNTGAWSGSIWDLSEDNVNNLAEGREYTGGTIIYTPWNSYEKIWWWKNACVSSVIPNRRYCNFGIAYS
jgi:hypothetical protein